MNTSAEAIERFHKYLPTIRKAFGFSGEDLANLIGVSRATIINIENPKNKMSKIHYLAIRTILFEETKPIKDQHTINKRSVLNDLLRILVDKNDISEETRKYVYDEINCLINVYGKSRRNRTELDPIVGRVLSLNNSVLYKGFDYESIKNEYQES